MTKEMQTYSLPTRMRMAWLWADRAYGDKPLPSGWQRMCIGLDSMVYHRCSDSGRLILSFMGTGSFGGSKSFAQKVRQWLCNTNALDRGQNDIHGGFDRSVQPYVAAMTQLATESTETVFVGHSRGGALALIASYYLGKSGDSVYQFGSPRSGGVGLADMIRARGMSVYDVVHGADCVPSYPPYEIGYRSIGLRISLPAPAWHRYPVLRRFMRVADHRPSQYRAAIDRL